MLLLFDIDLTLVNTGGAGMRALRDAAEEAFGRPFHDDGVEYAGRIDPLIIRDLLHVNGVAVTADHADQLRDGYARRLERELTGAVALPGVHDLLAALAQQQTAMLGLLTGNFRVTGEAKLRAAGIDPARFAVAAWGDESPIEPPRREHLPPVAMRRYAERTGRAIAGERVTIIGDTPHDVACGLAHGCRVLGVATGRTPAAELAAAGAHRVVADLSGTEEVVAWLLER